MSKLVTVPNPILKQKTTKVGEFNAELKNQIDQMVTTLRQEGGIGIAANQLGYSNQVVAIEFADLENKKETEFIPLTVFVNPEIVEYSQKKECFDEGCLSVPKIELEVERPSELKVKYEDQNGVKHKIAPKGLLARILQHEIDHLNGTLFTERAKENLFRTHPEIRKTKIIFFGSGEFASTILEGLIHLGLNVDIYTEAAKNAGRDQAIRFSPVSQKAKKFNREVIEVTDIDEIVLPAFDLLICADFGQKIPSKILEHAEIDAVNLHPSLLPKYQGPTPIQTAILDGQKTTGVSIIRMTSEIDKGPILAQIEADILDDDDAVTLRERLATLGLKLLAKKLPDIVAGNLEGLTQTPGNLTHKFKKEDGQINWDENPAEIERLIRALYPWPGTYTYIGDKRLLVHSAHLDKNELVLDIVQLEGKKPVRFTDFLRGWRGEKPDWLKKIKLAK